MTRWTAPMLLRAAAGVVMRRIMPGLLGLIFATGCTGDPSAPDSQSQGGSGALPFGGLVLGQTVTQGSHGNQATASEGGSAGDSSGDGGSGGGDAGADAGTGEGSGGGGAGDPNSPNDDPNASADPNLPADPNQGDPNQGDPNQGDPPPDPNNPGDPNQPPPFAGFDEPHSSYYLTGVQAYYIYEPAHVASAPVIIFLHGYNALDPSSYGGWIDHLLANGNTVILPVYQDYTTLDWQFLPNAVQAIQHALANLNEPNRVAPQLDRVAIFTHSIGGVVAMNLAAEAVADGLPVPRALFLGNPGDADSVMSLPPMQLSDYQMLPSNTFLISVTGDLDTVVGTTTAMQFYNKAQQIPTSQRMVIEFISDNHGLPPIIAQHGAALSTDSAFVSGNPGGRLITQDPGGPVTSSIDTLDYLGYWAIGDAVLSAAFNGTALTLPSGGSSGTIAMGHWSDGVAVHPALVLMP